MKKIFTKQLVFIFACTAFLASACSTNVSITKRYHNHGFHIAWESNKQHRNNILKPKSAKDLLKKEQATNIAKITNNTIAVQPALSITQSYTINELNPKNALSNKKSLHSPPVIESPYNKIFSNNFPQIFKPKFLNKTVPQIHKNSALNKDSNSPLWSILSFVCGILALYIVVICSAPGIDVPLIIILGILLGIASVSFGSLGLFKKWRVLAGLGMLIGGLALLMGLLTALLGTGAG